MFPLLSVCFSGTGGNNHAVDHYNETKHPLAVKLGTITTEGGGEYSVVLHFSMNSLRRLLLAFLLLYIVALSSLLPFLCHKCDGEGVRMTVNYCVHARCQLHWFVATGFDLLSVHNFA